MSPESGIDETLLYWKCVRAFIEVAFALSTDDLAKSVGVPPKLLAERQIPHSALNSGEM